MNKNEFQLLADAVDTKNPKRELKRISEETIEFFHPKNRDDKVDYNSREV